MGKQSSIYGFVFNFGSVIVPNWQDVLHSCY